MPVSETERHGTPAEMRREAVETLGHANRFANLDSEFRYDGRVQVPRGVTVKGVKYTYAGHDSKEPNQNASPVERGVGGTGEQYEVIDTVAVGDEDLITFTLRGDLDVDSIPNGQRSRQDAVTVAVTLSNSQVRAVSAGIEVLRGSWDKKDPADWGRPFVRLPCDGNWDQYPGQEGRSQAGFGYVTDSGLVHDRTLFLNLVDLRLEDESDDGYVYFQLVHEDGTPSNLTPKPKKQYLRARNDSSKSDWVDLPAFHMGELGDKPGYYRFLVWPQAQDGDSSGHQYSWDPSREEDAFQVGSVYFKYRGYLPEWARHSFTVTGGRSPATVEQGEADVYPSVTVRNTGTERIGRQTVIVRAPQGMWFTDRYLYLGKGGPTPSVIWGAWSHDRTLLRCEVPLDLGPGEFATLWAPMAAASDAPVGPAEVTYEVGDVRGAAEFEITPVK